MQSYSLYTTSEFLKDRHPYIPEPNPRPLMDPEQIAIAYNERCIPKLADLLIYPELSSQKRRDALHTLNELVSHQETKVIMINNKIVLSATNLMKDENHEVRFEAAYLVGSLLFLDVGRLQFDSDKENYNIIQNLINDPITKVRESIGWLLYRLSLHKDGTMLMNQSLTIQKIVEAFNKYCVPDSLAENVIYLLYLLEAIINCSMYDYNIKQTLNKELLKNFNDILDDQKGIYSSKISKGHYRQMRELILCACKNITLIFEGKNEAYKENLIITCRKFLNSPLQKERLYSSSMFMSITNILGAKHQISDFTNEEEYQKLLEKRIRISSGETGPEEDEEKDPKEKARKMDFAYSNNSIHYEILEKICLLLEDDDYDIKQNSILCLRNLATLPANFNKIVDILHEKLELLNEVFGVKALKGLTDLLPKLSTYRNPPVIEKDLLPKYTKVIKGLIHFYKKYHDDALDILIHETVNINQKLGPFYLLNDSNLHKYSKFLIERINKKDVENQRVFNEFMEVYGNKEKTNVSKEFQDSIQLSDLL